MRGPPPHTRTVIGDGVAHAERIALCSLLDELGPDAPTLCAGWKTIHMAAHLAVRDRSPAAMAGIVVAQFHGITERQEREALHSHTYAELVQLVRDGPPLTGPVGLPVAREVFNVHEFFVHHEDVRRPNGLQRRRLSPALTSALRLRLRIMAPALLRRVRGTAVALDVRGEDIREVRRGDRGRVVLHGTAGELLLYLFNRRADANVRVTGDAAAIDRLGLTRLGP